MRKLYDRKESSQKGHRLVPTNTLAFTVFGLLTSYLTLGNTVITLVPLLLLPFHAVADVQACLNDVTITLLITLIFDVVKNVQNKQR